MVTIVKYNDFWESYICNNIIIANVRFWSKRLFGQLSAFGKDINFSWAFLST